MEFYEKDTLFYIGKHIGLPEPNDDHFHNLYEFNYLKKGNCEYLINNELYNLESGDVVIMPPNTLHKGIHKTNTIREKIFFYMDKQYLSTFLDSRMSLPNTPVIYHTSNFKRIDEIFEELHTEFNTKKQRVYMEILIGELIVLLQRMETKNFISQKNTSSNIIPQVLEYIKTHFTSNIKLEEVASRFYMNPSYFSRMFKEQTGFMFSEYITKLRIKEANKMLSLTDKSITKIAFDCGFNSSNNFCKTYKKTMGISALEYRKKAKNIT